MAPEQLFAVIRTRGARLIIRATTSDEICARLSADPGTRMDLLRISQVTPWTVRLGSVP